MRNQKIYKGINLFIINKKERFILSKKQNLRSMIQTSGDKKNEHKRDKKIED